MKCKVCGKEIPENTKFCKYCGAFVEKDAPHKKSKFLLVVVIITILAATALLAAVGIYFLDNRSSEKQENYFDEDTLINDETDSLKEDIEEISTNDPEENSETVTDNTPTEEFETKISGERENTDETAENVNVFESIDMNHIQSIYASSSLSEYNMTHAPERAADGDLSTAWVEGADGQGIGETIVFLFDGDYSVNGISINAGYQKSSDLYYKNSRPEKITVTASDGMSEEIILQDVMDVQKIQLSTPLETDSITVTINSVYPGSKYEDTAISEMGFY